MVYRKTVIELLGDKCSLCDSTHDLIVHHKDRNRKNNSVENLELLCASCHNKTHPLNNTKKAYPRMLNLYVPYNMQSIIASARKKAKQEGTSLSKIFVDFCQRYIKK